MMHTYIDRWLQHLHHVHSYECQVSYGDTSQVSSQSQCRQHCPEEWLQFPDQSRLEIGQWHLGRQIHWIMRELFLRNMSRYLKCKPTKSAIWGRLDIIFNWTQSFYYTVTQRHNPIRFSEHAKTVAYLLMKIQAVCMQLLHQMYPKSHHTQCPMHYCCKFPLDLQNSLYHLEVWCHH